jgi:error-prone DNA polymerase
MIDYAELQVTSGFSFLEGASHPHELAATARALGHRAIAITDRNSFAGAVRMLTACEGEGLRLVIGTRLVLSDGAEMLAYPTCRTGYGDLCALLSLGRMRAPKGACEITLEDVLSGVSDCLFIALPGEGDDAPAFRARLKALKARYGDAVYGGAVWRHGGRDPQALALLATIYREEGIAMVALNDVRYHSPDRRPLMDVMTATRHGVRLDEAGHRLGVNAERHLKSPREMARLFSDHPEAVQRSTEIVARTAFSLRELSYHYPDEPVPPGKTADQHLRDLTLEGARTRYPRGVPEKVTGLLHKELTLIARLNIADYFLTVHDIVAYARSVDILCQGRGSAANSAVCFCLGITAVDPSESSLLFERFISEERREPPDIDVDFEHERREEVMQYVYRRYGRHRAALTATVITYRPRSALREVCKVLGLGQDTAAALAATVWGSWGTDVKEDRLRQAGFDPDNPAIARALTLARQLMGFPRHLSQHVGGFVLTRDALSRTVPIGNAAMEARTFIEWDKDDINELKIMKVDVLALGMLTCIAKGLALIARHKRQSLGLADVPREDRATYDMLCRADSLGVFQVESRAQMNMLPRLQPRTFYDLVIQVAIVRPGPIQGDMVHPYLRRRKGEEAVVYPRPHTDHGRPDELQNILGRTLGVPLFQEQAMQIAIDAARFTPDEANGLRRAMATFRKVGTISHYEQKMVEGMIRRGYSPEFSARCFDQIKGFGEYGFPESHAASFAKLVYVSSWMKCHHPEVFACALLNSQPMGFYAPAQIVRDAREHGVCVRRIDINASDWDCTMEPAEPGGSLAMRLGMRLVDGLAEADARRLVAARAEGYRDIASIRRRAGVYRQALEQLAAADAFTSLGLNRREALWQVRGQAPDAPLPLFAAGEAADIAEEARIALPVMPRSEAMLQDYQSTRLSLEAHPLHFLRPRFAAMQVLQLRDATHRPEGQSMWIAGVVLVRQRPGTASGVVFVTLEDETGIANLVIWPSVLERYRPVVMGARIMLVRGRIQRADGVTHVIADELIDRTDDLQDLTETSVRAALERQFGPADHGRAPIGTGEKSLTRRISRLPQDDPLRALLSPADEVKNPVPEERASAPRKAIHAPRHHPRNVRIIPKSRDFH